jgi:hypothetical protein
MILGSVALNDIDRNIHEHNQKLYKGWFQKEKVTFEIKSDITKETIKVTLEGDFITCKDCRDKILSGWNWTQGSLQRKKI